MDDGVAPFGMVLATVLQTFTQMCYKNRAATTNHLLQPV